MKSINITVLDLTSVNQFGAYNQLPSLNNLNDITDINSVHSIRILCASEEEAREFASTFPKTYKARVHGVQNWNIDPEKSTTTYEVSFHFNTFHMDETTGSTNESAVQRRIKVINKLKSIM